jgi:FkbM family methyltransferase
MSYFESDAEIGRALVERGYSFPTIYDIGGSNGAWTSIMSKVFPNSRFELFEPLAEINATYKAQLKHLKTVHADAHMNAVAIGESDGKIDIHMSNDPSGSTTLPIGQSESFKAVSVPMRSIDSIVKEGKSPPPDFIKIDIQGGEMAALKGAANTLPGVQFLLLETWLQRGYGKSTPLLHELIAVLADQNFVPYEFTDVYRGSNGESVSIDVVFINKRKYKYKGKHLYNFFNKYINNRPY